MPRKYLTGILISVITLIIYLFFCKKEFEILHYFMPLANSFLHAKIDISGYDYLNELVASHGKSYVVYPPMPAILLVPFALIYNMSLSQVYPMIAFAALSGFFFYLFLIRLTSSKNSLSLTILLLFGTNFFMTSLIGRSWYFAHVCAVLLMAISLLFASKRNTFWSGFFLALAFLSRLPTLLAFPFLLFLIKPKLKQSLSFFVPIFVAVLLFGLYNYARFGSIFETGYSLIPGVLEEPWFKEGIFSWTYIPRNLEAILAYLPKFSNEFPFVILTSKGMALWATTPAFLMILFALKNKLTQVALVTFVLVMLPSFMHGSVGFSQFGYRFSLDAILILITGLVPAIERFPRLGYILISASIIINFYAVWLFYLGIFKP